MGLLQYRPLLYLGPISPSLDHRDLKDVHAGLVFDVFVKNKEGPVKLPLLFLPA